MISLVGYELFLPAVTAAVYAKKKDDFQLTESEFKQIVSVTFRDSVIRVMKDSLLYRIEIPIDVYQNVKRYDLIPPDGYLIEDVVCLKSHRVNVPNNYHTLSSLMLTCCPSRDVTSAFFVEVALSPKRSSGICKFNENFIEMHYDLILSDMFKRLSAMHQRVWRSLGTVNRYEKEYTVKLNRAKRQSLNGGGILKIHARRLSQNG